LFVCGRAMSNRDTGVARDLLRSLRELSPRGGAAAPGGGLTTSSSPRERTMLKAASASTNVLRYNGTTGAFIGVFASGGGLDQPSFLIFSSQVSPVPQAATLTLLAAGLVMCILAARRRT